MLSTEICNYRIFTVYLSDSVTVPEDELFLKIEDSSDSKDDDVFIVNGPQGDAVEGDGH